MLTLEICGYRYYVCHWGDERRQQNKYIVDLCRLCDFIRCLCDDVRISVLSRKISLNEVCIWGFKCPVPALEEGFIKEQTHRMFQIELIKRKNICRHRYSLQSVLEMKELLSVEKKCLILKRKPLARYFLVAGRPSLYDFFA